MERSIRARAPWQARAAPGLGVLATCLVAVGSCSLSFSHAGAWAWSPVDRLGSAVDRSLAGGLIGTGVTLLVVAWWLLRPGEDRSRPPSAWLLVLWALPLVLVPPVLTGDAFVYADGGWILHAGGDVDADPIASLGGPYAAGVDAFWAGKTSAYPALAVLVGQAAAAGSGYDPYWGVVGQRLVALAALALAALLLLHVGRRLGVDPAWSVWFGLLNPFVVLHLVGGGHNDAVMIAAALVALAVALRWGHVPAVCWLGSPALIGMAMAVKPQAVVVLVPAMIWPLLERSSAADRRRGRRASRGRPRRGHGDPAGAQPPARARRRLADPAVGERADTQPQSGPDRGGGTAAHGRPAPHRRPCRGFRRNRRGLDRRGHHLRVVVRDEVAAPLGRGGVVCPGAGGVDERPRTLAPHPRSRPPRQPCTWPSGRPGCCSVRWSATWRRAPPSPRQAGPAPRSSSWGWSRRWRCGCSIGAWAVARSVRARLCPPRSGRSCRRQRTAAERRLGHGAAASAASTTTTIAANATPNE